MVNAIEGGALMSKAYEAAYELLEKLASNNYRWFSKKSMPRKVVRVIHLDPITNLTTQLETIVKQLGKFNVNYIQTNVVCIHCARNHPSTECQVGESLYPTIC